MTQGNCGEITIDVRVITGVAGNSEPQEVIKRITDQFLAEVAASKLVLVVKVHAEYKAFNEDGLTLAFDPPLDQLPLFDAAMGARQP